jgi:hypothetical protein
VCILLLLVVILVPMVFLITTVVGEMRDLYKVMAEQSRNEGGWGEYFNHGRKPVGWVAQRTGMEAPELKAALLDKGRAVERGRAQVADLDLRQRGGDPGEPDLHAFRDVLSCSRAVMWSNGG